jgi:hypothetical protein
VGCALPEACSALGCYWPPPSDCAESNNGLLAPPLGTGPDNPGVELPEDPDNYFDPSQDLDLDSSCDGDTKTI